MKSPLSAINWLVRTLFWVLPHCRHGVVPVSQQHEFIVTPRSGIIHLLCQLSRESIQTDERSTHRARHSSGCIDIPANCNRCADGFHVIIRTPQE